MMHHERHKRNQHIITIALFTAFTLSFVIQAIFPQFAHLIPCLGLGASLAWIWIE